MKKPTMTAHQITLADAMADHFAAMPPPGAWTSADLVAEYERRGLKITQRGASGILEQRARELGWKTTTWMKRRYYWAAK